MDQSQGISCSRHGYKAPDVVEVFCATSRGAGMHPDWHPRSTSALSKPHLKPRTLRPGSCMEAPWPDSSSACTPPWCKGPGDEHARYLKRAATIEQRGVYVQS